MSTQPSEIIFAVQEAPEGGFVARALGHSIFTGADHLDALREAVRDAIRCHFDDGDRAGHLLIGRKTFGCRAQRHTWPPAARAVQSQIW